MNITKTTLSYFSPTGSTKAIGKAVGERLGGGAEIDLTDFCAGNEPLCFSAQELLVIGMPVYGGRIPGPATEKLLRIRGDGTPAVLIAVYGNREYDDALLELKTLVEERGCKAVAAAAFVAEHSIVRSIAEGRPDGEDQKAFAAFADQVVLKLAALESAEAAGDLFVKGNAPYREYKGMPFHPRSNRACVRCGLCAAQCPVKAIPLEDPAQTDKSVCITCMRCVQVCPYEARSLNAMASMLAKKAIAGQCKVRKEPGFFF